jgi:hypothetical protein
MAEALQREIDNYGKDSESIEEKDLEEVENTMKPIGICVTTQNPKHFKGRK